MPDDMGNPTRNESFGDGIVDSPTVMDSESLMADAERFNARVPKGYVPTGSASGMSADQASATMNGMLPVSNGSASDTYENKKWFDHE